MLAVELVAFDIRKHPMRERDHLVIRRALVIRAEQLAIVRDELAPLLLKLPDRALERLSRAYTAHVLRKTCERHGEIVVPGPMIVIEAIANIDVEPGVAGGLQLIQPL